MEEFNKLKEASKDILSKDHHKKLESVNCLTDKKHALKFMMVSEVKMRHLELEELIKESEDHEDFHAIYLKSSLIPPKITFLQQDFQEKDFKKIIALLDELELRLLNNGSL